MNTVSRDELLRFQKQYGTDYSIGDLTPTVCELMGIPEPSSCGGTPIPVVVDHAGKLCGGSGKIQKTLIFCPDAVGEIHRQKHPDLLERVQKLAGFRCLASGVMPSVTPVCYGTIFSGASPEVHGIRKYEKPVLPVETLFDVAPKAGLKTAIVAVNECSIDKIFRNRKISYFSTTSDAESVRIGRMLLEHDDYDLLVVYATDHDHCAHGYGVDATQTVQALTACVESFEILSETADRVWKDFNRAVIWCPDHGNHNIDETHGAHGENIPDDMLVNHFYRIRAAGEK